MVMQRRRRMVTAAAAAGFVCGVMALTGCAGTGAAADGLGADSGESVRRAADALVRAGSSKVTTSMEMASGGTRVVITGVGDYDYRKGLGALRITLPEDAAGAQEHRPVTELMTPGSLYMKDRGAGVPADKWVRVDTTRLSDGNLVTGGATDPLAAAELLRGAQQVEPVGDETIAGVRVRHYRGVTDIARAARGASPATRQPLAAAARGFSVTRVPFDVYLDAQGRPRKVSQRFTFSSGASGAAGGRSSAGKPAGKPGAPSDVTVTSTTVFDGFGTQVSVVLPKSADIYNGKIVTAPPK